MAADHATFIALKVDAAPKNLFAPDPPATPAVGAYTQPPLTAEQEHALKTKDCFKECDDCQQPKPES